tara:strand:+ start:1036 stop:1659 length:624 start_codon:yes stop_codon:yes gene_type:complete
MTRFLIISLLLVLCNSCALKTTEGLRVVQVQDLEVANPYFSNAEIDYVYKAKIEIYGRYFGGILIIKKVEKNSHRVVFTTEFGNKIFDFLYKGDTFVKNFVLEDLDKKIIVNTLEKDFRLLISENAKVVEQFVSEGQDVYKTRNNNRFNFYFFDEKPVILKRIVQTSKSKEKVEIVFTSQGDNLAQKIGINHSNIKLKIDLNYFKKE